jgi:hypothetical protein
MRKRVWAMLFCLLAAAALSFGRKDESIEQLIARADAARPDQQSDLYMQVADRTLKAALEASKASQWEQFRADLQQIVKYSDSAHSAALHTDKHLKRTEIKIREISTRLRDLKLSVDVDEQAGVQAAVDRLEGLRTELLHSMFGSKNND